MGRFVLLLVAQVCAAGPQLLTFHSAVDDTEQPYAVYVPAHLDPAQKYPLVVSLHAEGTNHVLNLRQVFGRVSLGTETEGEASRHFPALPEVEFIVACPLARGDLQYEGIAERDVYDMLADVRKRFPIDDDRVYLTGISMGGGAALRLGLTRPDQWAAIAPVSAETPPGTEALAGNALNLPVQLFHGESDPLAPAETARQWLRRFLELGVHAEYIEYPAVLHNAWQRAYGHSALFAWFAKFRRQRYPDRVRFASSAYRYDAAYWVRLDRLTPGTPASIDARFTAANRVEVKTQELDGFTLRLAGHPQFTRAAPLAATIDGVALRPRGRETVSFVRTARGWTTGSAPAPAGSKRPGLEGPLAAAIAERHIYVYGTADAAGEEEIARRRAVATAASEWSSPRVRVLVSFVVKADTEVTAEDLAGSNLVLFGNQQTNRVIARFAGQMPLELNRGAADYGLVWVCPVGNRYALVNSGLPWWTGASARPWQVLDRFGDYVLFRGSIAQVVAEGRFDRDWKLPQAAAAKMAATGAVVIATCCQKNSADTGTK